MKDQPQDLLSFIEIDDLPSPHESNPRKKRGRPALTVTNPLDKVPPSFFVNSDGLPVVWLDDILTGSSRMVGQRDQRRTTKAPYVSMKKIIKVLLMLPGKLTPRRVSEALNISHDNAWRIVSVINFASLHIQRVLSDKTRVREYIVPPHRRRKLHEATFQL